MSERVDKFTNGLRDRLNAAEERINSLKSRLQSAPKQAQDELRRELQAAKQKVEAGKQSVEKARTDAGQWIERKKSEAASAIDQWKAKREANKLNERAEEAEDYAVAEIEIAVATIDEDEQALLEAIVARLDADAVAV